ncbi:MAG TPA: acyltransferase family protein [Clostridia bacterium]|nr:acyltransferase family protein [Clostridia bacterium]
MPKERIHYLDWLKVLIVYGILVFHVSLVFTVGGWLVSNREKSPILGAFAGFCFPWGIPAMFLIAGADAWFGLRSHSVGEFIRGRFLRLLVPFAAGLILLSPLQRFITSRTPPPPIDTFWTYYLAFFRGLRFEWTLQLVSRYWLHLWFLGYLFVISLACVPIVVWLRRPGGRRLTSRLVAIANRRGGLFLLAAPLCFSQLLLRPRFPLYQDWADVATFTLAFLFGAVIFGDRRFEAGIRREIRLLLLVGVVATLGVGWLVFVAPSHMPEDARVPAGAQAAFALLWSLDIWCWLLAVLYLGIRWLDFPNRVLTYLQQSVLPFYVIHHPVVLLVASFVVTWNLGVWAKFAIILVVAFGITLGLYEFGVRRWGPTRLLFGLAQAGNEPKIGHGAYLSAPSG